MCEEKIKHLDYIQNVITRMNANSFQIKTWTVTIIAALLALSANNKSPIFIFIAIIPTMIFWFLDTYYLQQEKKFRGVYDDVCELTEKEEKQEIKLFEMPIQKYKGGKYSYSNVFFSKTLLGFYLSINILLFVMGMIFCLKDCFRIIFVCCSNCC